VLSGNRNFEGRIHPNTRANYLASPLLVIAYAIAGRIDIDFETEPIGEIFVFAFLSFVIIYISYETTLFQSLSSSKNNNFISTDNILVTSPYYILLNI